MKGGAVQVNKKISKAVKAGVISLFCLSAACGTGKAYAYFSGTSDLKLNQVSLVQGETDQDGAIVIIEPEWDARKEADEGYAMEMQPGQTVVKDPQVESRVDYPCWVFVEVMIPNVSATLNKADNPYPYVTFEGDETDYVYSFEMVVPEINEADWEIYQRSYGKNLIEYTYGYKHPLPAHETSSPIFETITIPEFKQAEGNESYIMLRGKAVQTEGCPTLEDAAKKLGIEKSIVRTVITP